MNWNLVLWVAVRFLTQIGFQSEVAGQLNTKGRNSDGFSIYKSVISFKVTEEPSSENILSVLEDSFGLLIILMKKRTKTFGNS